MTSESSLPPREVQDLDFETAAAAGLAQARRRYWRALVAFAAGFVLVTGVLAVTSNAFRRLSITRTAYWPASLSKPIMRFDESDPLARDYVYRGACEQSGDEAFEFGENSTAACEILASLARGEIPEALKLVRGLTAHDDRYGLRLLNATLASQLVDSAKRRDWATCSFAAGVALQVLEKEDSAPQSISADDNRLLLLASGCEFAHYAFVAEDDYVELTSRIATGMHLDHEYIHRMLQRPMGPMLSWGRYLDGIAKLRAREFLPAATSFRACFATTPSGMLRELSLLGIARALFWQHRLAEHAPPEIAKRTADNVRAELRAIGTAIRRTSFRNDVEYYVREVRR